MLRLMLARSIMDDRCHMPVLFRKSRISIVAKIRIFATSGASVPNSKFRHNVQHARGELRIRRTLASY
jgi:hypothetical protein